MFDQKKYYIENRKKIIEYGSNYYLNHRKKIRKYYKRYYIDNKEKYCSKCNPEYYQKHKEKIKEYYKKYYIKNKKESSEQSKQWREKNPERAKENRQRWHNNNPEERKAIRQRKDFKRQIREREIVNTLTSREWLYILKTHNYKCFYCNCEFTETNPPTRDHIIPISKGGNNIKENIAPACRVCNSKKSNKIIRPFQLAIIFYYL